MIAAGYEDCNDADTLRHDPMFKLAMGRLPNDSDLCSQPTISRLENLPDARTLLSMGCAMVEHYCHSFRQVSRRIVLDIDDTFDAVHAGQQLRLPSDRGVRWRRPHDYRRAAPGQQALRQADRALAASADHRDPWPLATGDRDGDGHHRGMIERRTERLLAYVIDVARGAHDPGGALNARTRGRGRRAGLAVRLHRPSDFSATTIHMSDSATPSAAFDWITRSPASANALA